MRGSTVTIPRKAAVGRFVRLLGRRGQVEREHDGRVELLGGESHECRRPVGASVCTLVHELLMIASND